MTARTITHGSFTLERRWKTTPARVFRALSDQATKQKWFNPPEAWGKSEHHLDFRVGGVETSVGGPPGGAVHKFKAIYQDIVPDERIIYTYDMHLDEVRISVSLTSFEISPDGDHTILVMSEHGAFLDGFAGDGNEIRRDGTSQLLDQLGRFWRVKARIEATASPLTASNLQCHSGEGRNPSWDTSARREWGNTSGWIPAFAGVTSGLGSRRLTAPLSVAPAARRT